MKTLRRLTATLFLLCMAGMTMAQDVIVMKDQTTVMSKVLEITSTEIKYKKWNNQDGPTYSINRSEVVSINYENGEVEKFSDSPSAQPNTNQKEILSISFMDIRNGYLELNGHRLSDKEVQSLVDEQNYQLYLKGKHQNNIAPVLFVVGIIPAGLGILGLCYSPQVVPEDRSSWLTISSITSVIGIAVAVPGIVLTAVGMNKWHQVAEAYNKSHGIPYSLNISPSMMRCEIPQSQGNCGFGLTLSMNF